MSNEGCEPGAAAIFWFRVPFRGVGARLEEEETTGA
jgi:hypothetical protein